MVIYSHIDPNNTFIPRGAKHSALIDACGILPMFFTEAVEDEPADAQLVYDRMVLIYGFGDSSGPHWGTLDSKGTYISSHEEDKPLDPLLSMKTKEGVELFIYQYAIIALRDKSGKTIISRMD